MSLNQAIQPSNMQQPKALRINVHQVSTQLDNPQDEGVTGIYAVLFNDDVHDLPDAKRASIALDIFHAHQGIKCLDDFAIDVIDEAGNVIEQDPDHEPYSAADDGDIEKTDDSALTELDLQGSHAATEAAKSVTGWTAEKLADLLLRDAAMIKPFNDAYVRLFMRIPSVNTAAISDPLNRMFAEGAPDYRSPALVPKTIADEAMQLLEPQTGQ